MLEVLRRGVETVLQEEGTEPAKQARGGGLFELNGGGNRRIPTRRASIYAGRMRVSSWNP